jgi:hypothetical protein
MRRWLRCGRSCRRVRDLLWGHQGLFAYQARGVGRISGSDGIPASHPATSPSSGSPARLHEFLSGISGGRRNGEAPIRPPRVLPASPSLHVEKRPLAGGAGAHIRQAVEHRLLTPPKIASASVRWPGTSTTPTRISSLTLRTTPTSTRSLKSRTARHLAPVRGVARAQHAARLALALTQERVRQECRVRLEIVGRRQQPQGPFGGVLFFLRIWLPDRHRRHALGCELRRIDLELARFGAELLADAFGRRPLDMSGSMKAQHIGVYCVILSMHLNDVLVTRRSICDVLRMADTHIGPKVL